MSYVSVLRLKDSQTIITRVFSAVFSAHYSFKVAFKKSCNVIQCEVGAYYKKLFKNH